MAKVRYCSKEKKTTKIYDTGLVIMRKVVRKLFPDSSEIQIHAAQ